jgi:hypothetical protein
MGISTKKPISYQELLKFRDMNQDMHPTLRMFASNLSYKVKSHKNNKNNNNNNNNSKKK